MPAADSTLDHGLPPVPAQVAIVLGFLLGTWLLVDGLTLWVTGQPIRLAGHAGPWSGWGPFGALAGAAWMLIGNLYLFQNSTAAWKALAILVVLCSWSAGWAVVILLAQLVLLLHPATRRALRR